MNLAAMIVNAARRLDGMFPGYFPATKHNHYGDFGWPQSLTFPQLYGMYLRNGLARAGVERTIAKTWQDSPQLWETEDEAETRLEAEIRQRFDDLRLWQMMAECDRRAMVGGYAGLIIRFRDGLPFDQPVRRMSGGLDAIAEVIPAWGESQIEVAEWNSDTQSEDYGKPRMFRFNEAALSNRDRLRQFNVHPDRVLVWSADGSVHARSLLEPGFNDLLDAEKVKGAGGEGFWKSARGSQVLEADKELNLDQMAKAMGVPTADLADAMNAQVQDFQRGFDKMPMLQGMQAKTLTIDLPSPEPFFNVAVSSFAASLNMPVRILVGNQTGERASTEDAREWSHTCNARRANTCRPLIGAFVARLERFGVLPQRDWHIEWSDLTEDSQELKIDRAAKMTAMNAQQSEEPVFTVGEIRRVAGFEEEIEAT